MTVGRKSLEVCVLCCVKIIKGTDKKKRRDVAHLYK
jgi:hypothetical protein